jgi:hypothetical protein
MRFKRNGPATQLSLVASWCEIMKKYYVRICWNSCGWVFPTGEAKELETDSYVTKAGFGQEEWLFNFAWMIDGYHYAFLQPVNNSFKKVTGSTLGLLLYCVNPNQGRVYIAEVKNCEVLTAVQAEECLRRYKKAGWLKSMGEQIGKIGGETERLDTEATSLFNVRFRPEDVDFYQPQRLAQAKDLVMKLNRYTLVEADQQIVNIQWRRRKGTKIPPAVLAITRSGHPGVIYDPIHAALQGKLFELLRARFGSDAVVLEADFVDITLQRNAEKTLIEIKSDPDARIAIRKALGQILEYAYFNPNSQNADAKLVIVSPGGLTANVSGYLNRLRTNVGIRVSYCAFSLGDALPQIFIDNQP